MKPLLSTAVRCRIALLGLALTSLASAVQAEPVRVLVAYSSETGNTEKMARGVAAGVRSVEGAEALLRLISEVTKEEATGADAIVLGSPVHMADVSAEMRQAMVAWSREFGFWRSKALQDKVGAVFATGAAPSNGKEFTMMSMALSMLQFGMVLVTPYGGIGASAATAIPESDKGVDERELTEARNLGARVAKIAARMRQR